MRFQLVIHPKLFLLCFAAPPLALTIITCHWDVSYLLPWRPRLHTIVASSPIPATLTSSVARLASRSLYACQTEWGRCLAPSAGHRFLPSLPTSHRSALGRRHLTAPLPTAISLPYSPSLDYSTTHYWSASLLAVSLPLAYGLLVCSRTSATS